MNLSLLLIVKLLSRPVVSANFQGLDENTFSLVSGVDQYNNIDIFLIDPLSDLRLGLEASGCRDFDNVTSFTKFKIVGEGCVFIFVCDRSTGS